MRRLRFSNFSDLFAGISRHGVLAVERVSAPPRARSGTIQVASMLLGSTFIGLGVAMFVGADLGVPAYDVMLTALSDRLGISLGQAGWLFTGVLFLVATMLGQRPRGSGLVYVVANGLMVDVFTGLLDGPESMVLRMVFVVLGTLSISAGVALVLHAGLTGGSIELLMRAAEARGRDPFRARRWIEISVVVGGIALGGDAGPATVFFVLTMGPTLRAGRLALEDHRSGRHHRIAVT